MKKFCFPLQFFCLHLKILYYVRLILKLVSFSHLLYGGDSSFQIFYWDRILLICQDLELLKSVTIKSSVCLSIICLILWFKVMKFTLTKSKRVLKDSVSILENHRNVTMLKKFTFFTLLFIDDSRENDKK